jgi:pilus assembly protein CpaF
LKGCQLLTKEIWSGRLREYIDDPSIDEIWINDPDHVFISRRGVTELTELVLEPTELITMIDLLLRHSGRRVDRSQPFVDATLPDGSRLHVVIPDITATYPAINIRKYPASPLKLEQLVKAGAISEQAANYLKQLVAGGENILIAGGTGSGKTTLLNALLEAINPTDRVIVCEEVREINLTRPDWVSMQTRSASVEGVGGVDLRTLIVESLRMRPDRIVVGEVRQREALDLLIALNCGTPGMGTIHANNAREAITKISTLPLLAGANVSLDFVVPTVAAAIDAVVFVQKQATGERKVTEIAEVTGAVIAGEIQLELKFSLQHGELKAMNSKSLVAVI